MGSNVKYDPLSVGVDALAVGGGVAAIVAMIRQAAEANRQKKLKEKLTSGDVSPDTIVLRIPKKGLDKLSESLPTDKPGVSVKPGVETKEVKPLSTVGLRDLKGRFSTLKDSETPPPEKAAGFVDGVTSDTASILAGIGGVAGGYYVVSKLAQKLEQNRLRKQIEAAQTEYIDLLDGRKEKMAEARSFSTLFQFDDGMVESVSSDMEKSAGIPTDIVNVINGGMDTARKGSAVALASYILTAGGTAYVVKKYLESKYGKRDEEEKPTPQTRILIKPGSAEEPFEIDPGRMMATVRILRDCIEDSVDPATKQAADYSFLDKIEKMDGGPQFLLDSYARMNGLSRPESDFKLPVSMMLGYGKTLSDIKKDPSKHKAQLQGHVMQMMRRDPKKWFDLLGQDRNSDIVGMKADEQVANMRNSGGIMGFLHRIPLIGDLIRKMSSWFTKNTSMGRRGAAGKTLEMMGITGDRANQVMGMYDFSKSGWKPRQAVAAPAQTKKAGYGYGDIMAIMARDKTLTDSTNKEILKAIEELKKPRRKKGVEQPKVKVEFDDKLNEMLSEEDKARIIANLTK